MALASALKAGEAGECARQMGRFWEMHDELYAHQDQLAAALLPDRAKAAGLDVAAFKACLDGGKGLAKVKADEADGARAGIGGTPYFLFGVPEAGGKMKVLDYIYTGAVPIAQFQTILDKLVASAK